MEQETHANRVLRMKDLPFKTGFQPSTIYELIAKGRFPAPFKLTPGGRAAGWFETTIDDHMMAQAKNTQHVNSK